MKQSPWLHRLRKSYRRMRYSWVRVADRSSYDNLYHCCTQKTASMWFGAVFADPIFYKHSGLRVVRYSQLGLREAHFDGPFAQGTVVAHLYVDHPTYLSIPKPARYKSFFVLRDPRDIVVSMYFSAKKSHDPVGPIPEMRKRLNELGLEDGLRFVIDEIAGWGLFDAQRSWALAARNDAACRIFRYEDMASDNREFLRELLGYLEVKLPEDAFARLYDKHSFERLTQGRARGTEDQASHYRKGVAGDWVQHFTPPTSAYLRERTGDLLEVLGYADATHGAIGQGDRVGQSESVLV